MTLRHRILLCTTRRVEDAGPHGFIQSRIRALHIRCRRSLFSHTRLKTIYVTHIPSWATEDTLLTYFHTQSPAGRVSHPLPHTTAVQQCYYRRSRASSQPRRFCRTGDIKSIQLKQSQAGGPYCPRGLHHIPLAAAPPLLPPGFVTFFTPDDALSAYDSAEHHLCKSQERWASRQ